MKKQQLHIAISIILIVLIALGIMLFMVRENNVQSIPHIDTPEPDVQAQSGSADDNTFSEFFSILEKSKIQQILGDSPDRTTIYDLQNKFGPEVALVIDCELFSTQGDKKYCEEEKQFAIKFFHLTSTSEPAKPLSNQ